MAKCLIILPDGRIKEDDLSGLDELQTAVGGGLIEVLTCLGRPGREATLVINEEGKLRAFPPNDRATVVCTSLGAGLAWDDYIVGPMLVFGPSDDEGNLTDIRDYVALYINSFPLRETKQEQNQ